MLGLAGIAAACSSIRGANPELPTWVHRPSGALAVIFSRPVVAESRRVGEPWELGRPELDTQGRRVFVGSSDRGLYALRAQDGQPLWRFETLSFVQSAPLYDPTEDVVYFGSNDGALYKVRALDGELLWRFATNAEIARRPVLEGGTLYVANANDTVLALDARTGAQRWVQHQAPAQGMEIAGHSGVAVWRGAVYAAFSAGTVAAFDAVTGDERWPPVDLAAEAEAQLGEVPAYLDVDTTPVPDAAPSGPVVYVAAYVGGVHALDADGGNPVWANPAVAGATGLTLYTEPAHTGRDGAPREPTRLLLVASGTSGLWALDPETGAEIWRRPVPAGGLTAPVPWQGALLVSSSTLGLFLVSPREGAVIDGLHTGDGVSMVPAVHGRRAFVTTNGGRLLSLYVAPPR
ncbi:MAG: PQQ-binding-like beta-propeller repeat protein [Polyangiaceae bacterium]|nr:PQQ-binding-like beta-propeller repeat protein [Polyangiaceae bacterium]